MRTLWYLLVAGAAGVVTLVALPLLLLPPLGVPWAAGHRRRAAALLSGRPAAAPVAGRSAAGRSAASLAAGRSAVASVSGWVCLRWLPVAAVAGAVTAAAVVLCLGNVVFGAVVAVAWWAFAEPPRLFAEVPVTGWGTAAGLGLLQVALLAAVVRWGFPPLAAGHARLTLALLAPSSAERIEELTRTRAEVLDAHAAELRRIERDLHDGTQARLVAIAMRLAVARDVLPRDTAAVERLLREAHEGTEEAMAELRAVIRTTYPPILADRGLPGALATVADRAGVPVTLDIGELGRVPAAVEAVAYFAVTEALTNVAKHSHATHATVRLRREGVLLSVEIADNGRGGAEVTAGAGPGGGGTGLAGVLRRVAALDGTLAVTSPAGGPTRVLVEVPCAW
ncbi:histidine kinase [Dactylosporangium sp. NPDC005572]|uniref:sensor histidine kinase n=1 Tax=Dactylosporangium sp. NPDC005572 TaxID=3156889 RepID=UPI0033AF2423